MKKVVIDMYISILNKFVQHLFKQQAYATYILHSAYSCAYAYFFFFCKKVDICNKTMQSGLELNMGILSRKFLLRQDDNGNLIVATMTTITTMTTIEILDTQLLKNTPI